jgi:hypothetical protein
VHARPLLVAALLRTPTARLAGEFVAREKRPPGEGASELRIEIGEFDVQNRRQQWKTAAHYAQAWLDRGPDEKIVEDV